MRKIAPCHFSRICLFPINSEAMSSTLASTAVMRSKFPDCSKGSGLMVALTPRIQNTLKILDPTTFPMAMSMKNWDLKKRGNQKHRIGILIKILNAIIDIILQNINL